MMTFNKVNHFLKKIINKQFLRYSLFGVLTSILNLILFWGLLELNISYKSANFTTLIIVKITSYIVNRVWVFKSAVIGFMPVMKEFFAFMMTRGLTLLIDFLGVILLVEGFGLEPKISKYSLVIIVVIVNYFFGKAVFSNSKGRESHEQDRSYSA